MNIVLVKSVFRDRCGTKEITDALAYAVHNECVVEVSNGSRTVTIDPRKLPFGGDLLKATEYWLEKLLG